MATAAQLHAARNAGLKLAHVTQPYAQGDTPLSATEHAPTKAVIKAIADRAVAAAIGIGGEAPAGPATEARVSNGQVLSMTTGGGTESVTAAVAAGVATMTLATNRACVKSGLTSGVTVVGTGTKVTLTVANGKLTTITLSV